MRFPGLRHADLHLSGHSYSQARLWAVVGPLVDEDRVSGSGVLLFHQQVLDDCVVLRVCGLAGLVLQDRPIEVLEQWRSSPKQLVVAALQTPVRHGRWSAVLVDGPGHLSPMVVEKGLDFLLRHGQVWSGVPLLEVLQHEVHSEGHALDHIRPDDALRSGPNLDLQAPSADGTEERRRRAVLDIRDEKPGDMVLGIHGIGPARREVVAPVDTRILVQLHRIQSLHRIRRCLEALLAPLIHDHRHAHV
mmetsp:Transcript_13534/g.50354  ORF Transcript_13534/g.50354 Transcript_13534/m.50354 type:complete len:247 (+) Transcript_13534:334-1074(+)